MKLIFVNRYFHPDHSATSQMLSDLAFYLAAQGEQVHVVTSRLRYDEPEARLARRERTEGVFVHRVWTSRFGRHFLPGRALDYLTFYLSASLRLLRLVRRGDLVVAKTDPPLISVPAGWVAALRGARPVNWLQDLFPEVAIELGTRGSAGRFGAWLRRRRNRSLQRARFQVVLGERMRDRVLGEGAEPAKVRLIPNWADGSQIRPVEHLVNPLRREWGLDARFVVAYSGNLGRAHDYGTLLEAIHHLRGEPTIRFLFIGGGAGMEALRQCCRERGLEHVDFRPYQPRERLRDSLGVADLHLVVLRPELEGLVVPSKIYGILAAGRPTLFVGAEDGEVAAMLREAEAGVSVPIGAGAQLADEIRRCQADPAACFTMGRNARCMFDRHYSRDRALSKWMDLLCELK